MVLHGEDVSSYQGYNWHPARHDSIVFVKATQGTGYVNPDAVHQAQNARGAGDAVGWYHFLQHGNATAQARYFVQHADIKRGDVLVCDWEAAGCNQADKDEFIREVQRLCPEHQVGLYCNTSWWKTKDHDSFCGDFLWIAAYGVKDPGIQHEYKFWQYGDRPVDQDYAYFSSKAALFAWTHAKEHEPHKADGRPAPHVPAKKVEPKHERIDVVRTANKEIHGYGRPNGKVVRTVPKGYHLHMAHRTQDEHGVWWVQGTKGVWWRRSETTLVKPKPKPKKKPAPKPKTYKVRPGDTLSGIAKKFGTTKHKLVEANRHLIKDPDAINAGWVLTIK